MEKTRFDLETAIMNAWNTCDDIDLVFHSTDKLHLSLEECDTLQNQLLGLEHMHALRMARVWAIFEDLLKQGDLE